MDYLVPATVDDIPYEEPADHYCNALRSRCTTEGCDYKFSTGEVVCELCGAIRTRCRSYPAVGSTRCRFHGGHSPKGVSSTVYRGRGVSTSLPTNLLETYQLALNDANILELTSDIAILESRKQELFRQIRASGVSADLWLDLRSKLEIFNKHRRAAAGGNKRSEKAMATSLREIEEVVAAGYTGAIAWQEVYDVMDRQARLAEKEGRRREKAATIMTEDQVRQLLGYIVNSINTRVTDPDIKMALLADLERLNL